MIESAVLLVATGFGLGWLPWAPGTFGSLICLPLAWWLLGYPLWRQVLIMAVLLAVAVPLCHWASLWLGGGDAPQIVADEYLAFPIAVIGLVAARRPWVMGMAFVLFRLFDIIKPPPISQIEALGGGLGIVLDDVMAALYAWMVLAIGTALWRRCHLR
ncbi:phosphatidylglycerophosphatase A [Pseudomonas sp. o96-267]|jgi:phosphatidylglycerophosphatase A|uniref:phosphatidylglycerophosphatase A family protein n=1 Tax=Pseudomonas sp. o96-267 TaxID=2479853 RepID=UPI000F7A07F3|nr:phosphatidylglycerophosphatase A [Pseudomonas sp. o96-267]RRV27498.1 phosphatidylglycerophosphatase A [Pseudomonas sp. o96-267]